MKTIKVEQFEKEVLNKPGKTLVRFYADWCPYCRNSQQDAINVANQFEDKNIIFVNVENKDIWKEDGDTTIGLELIPTQRIYENGKVIWEHINVINPTKLIEVIKQKL